MLRASFAIFVAFFFFAGTASATLTKEVSWESFDVEVVPGSFDFNVGSIGDVDFNIQVPLPAPTTQCGPGNSFTCTYVLSDVREILLLVAGEAGFGEEGNITTNFDLDATTGDPAPINFGFDALFGEFTDDIDPSLTDCSPGVSAPCYFVFGITSASGIHLYVGDTSSDVPEPYSFALLGIGLIGFIRLKRRQHISGPKCF